MVKYEVYYADSLFEQMKNGCGDSGTVGRGFLRAFNTKDEALTYMRTRTVREAETLVVVEASYRPLHVITTHVVVKEEKAL